jgi:protein SCO1/2
MTTRRLVALLLVTMAVAVGFARTRRAPGAAGDAQTFTVTGVVTAPIAAGRVMVAHDEIPGYMAAMTMPFSLGPDAPPSLAVGDRVRFVLTVGPASALAGGFEITGHDAAVEEALRARAPERRTRLKIGDTLPPFSLTTHQDQPFTPADLRGRLTVVTFVFTRCPVPEFCPLLVKRFQQLQQVAGGDPAMREVRLVGVTLDPTFDTPPVLAAYATAMRAQPERWRFVTGSPGEIAKLTSAFAVHVERNGVLLDHTLATALVGPDGRIVEIWRGNGWKVAEVLDALRRIESAKAES